MKKICFVLTAEFAVKAFLREQIKALSQKFSVYVIVNTDNPVLLQELGLDATLIQMNIKRDISPFSDFICLCKLMSIFAYHRFDAVHSITPKAGLLAMLASWFTLRRIRVHTFQGEVWITKQGFMRWLLIKLDKLVAKISTHLTVVSKSEKQFLIEHNIIIADKAIVFSEGSISGVDLNRFYPARHKGEEIKLARKIPLQDLVLLYIGRLNRDKGILDLVNAYADLDEKNIHLMIVGPDEHQLLPEIRNLLIHKKKFLHIFPETETPEKFMNAADLLCLPSYREGFGVVIIEAAACGVPSIASNIYGITDAVVNNETGILHKAKDINEIRFKLEELIRDKEKRELMGMKAYTRVKENFDSVVITKAWCKFYEQVLN